MATKMTDFSKVKTTEYDNLLSKIQKGKTVVIPIINWDKQDPFDELYSIRKRNEKTNTPNFVSELYPSGYLKKLTFTDPRTLKPNTVELEDNKIYAGVSYSGPKPTLEEFLKNAQFYKDAFGLLNLPGWHTETEVNDGHFVGKVIEGDDWKDENGNVHYNTYDNWNLYINSHYDEIVDKILEMQGVDLHEFYTVDYVEGVVLDKLYKKDGSKVIAFRATNKCGKYYLTGDNEKELSDYDGVYYWNGCDEAFKPLETEGELVRDFDVSYNRAEKMFGAL